MAASKGTATACSWSTPTAGTIRRSPPSSPRGRCSSPTPTATASSRSTASIARSSRSAASTGSTTRPKKGTSANVALNITAGPHKDTQELQVHAFRWFNHYLKNDDSPIDDAAVKFFEPEQLKVFDKLPADQINTKIHETFVAAAAAARCSRGSRPRGTTMRDGWLTALAEKAFRGLPVDESALLGGVPTAQPPAKELWSVEKDGVRFAAYEFHEPGRRFDCGCMFCTARASTKPELNVLNVLDDQVWKEFLANRSPSVRGGAERTSSFPRRMPRAGPIRRRCSRRFPG